MKQYLGSKSWATVLPLHWHMSYWLWSPSRPRVPLLERDDLCWHPGLDIKNYLLGRFSLSRSSFLISALSALSKMQAFHVAHSQKLMDVSISFLSDLSQNWWYLYNTFRLIEDDPVLIVVFTSLTVDSTSYGCLSTSIINNISETIPTISRLFINHPRSKSFAVLVSYRLEYECLVLVHSHFRLVNYEREPITPSSEWLTEVGKAVMRLSLYQAFTNLWWCKMSSQN